MANSVCRNFLFPLESQMCGSTSSIFMWVNVDLPISARTATKCDRFSDFMKTNTVHRVLTRICKRFQNGMHLGRRRESGRGPGGIRVYELSVQEAAWSVSVPPLPRSVSLSRHNEVSREKPTKPTLRTEKKRLVESIGNFWWDMNGPENSGWSNQN